MDFTQISQYGNADTNHHLQPGDVIYVPPSIFAMIGYTIQTITYPITAIMGIGGSQAITVMTGGAL